MTIPKNIGRYEILDELGHGAMGAVFRGRDPVMGREVAVKTILAVALASEQSGEYRTRFYREARAAGALAHPGIIPVFDVGEQDGMPYLVMELVQGQTLADALKQGQRFTMERVCEIGQQIAEALGYAHRKGVIHRDIKPANILMTSKEVHGIERPRITDFGVAKLTAGEITTTGQMLGTPAFMPPEQFTGAPIDGRTDLFSLGVILYWMSTGEQPFPGETMTTVSYKIVHTEPIPPAKLNPSVPGKMEAVILKCLAKSPLDRYQTGEEVAQALMEVRTGTPAASMKAAAPTAAMGGGDAEVTLDATPSLSPRTTPLHTSAAGALHSEPGSATKQRYVPMVLGAAVLVAAAVGGVMVMNHRASSAPANQSTPQQPAATASQPATATASQEQVQAPAAKPAAKPSPAPAASTIAAKPAAGAPAAAQPTALNQPKLSPVAFNPKTLDPKNNTKLKIDLSHFPAGLGFTVEMDGKLYYKGAAGDKSEYGNMYVPPGQHTFRVTVSGGKIQTPSNPVTAQFVAKKRMALKVELKRKSNGSTVTSPTFDSETQVIATLKEDRFLIF